MNRIPRKQNRLVLDKLSTTLLIAFGVLAVVTGIVAFIVIRNLTSSMTMINIPGAPDGSTTAKGTARPGQTQAGVQPVIPGPTAVPWDGASRVNILIMGLDYRDWEAGEIPRTDSMILFTIDPNSKTAGMLSIPRDMWVNIPGFDYAKINTAYFLGESYKMPGGGPGLAVKTVEQFLGVPINYYAQIDFNSFVRFIDELGGLTMYIHQDIIVDPLGKNNTRVLKVGVQNLDGATVLGYARNRHTANDDFDRSSRQQEVIMALRDQILQFNQLPMLITKAPVLYNELSSGLRTNMSLQQIMQLALLAKDIPAKNIKKAVMSYNEGIPAKSSDGLDILIPQPDKIRLVRDSIFTTSGPISPVAVSGDPAELIKQEAARISLQNGTLVPGLASRTSDLLKAKGMNVVEEKNADQVYSASRIIIYTGKPYSISYLSLTMGISSGQIYNKYDPKSPYDIAIIMGTDWGQKIDKAK